MRAQQVRLAGPFVLPPEFSEAAPFETTVTRPLAQRHRAETYREQIHLHHGPWWPVEHSDEGVTEMTSAVVSNIDEIRELTIDELDQAGGGLAPVLLGVAVGFGVGVLVGAVAALIYLS